jgi:hypothetical protein
MARRGYLLIADLTGYTIFLTSSELDHAQGIIGAIINCMVGELRPPLTLSNLQGDAMLAYAADENVRQGQVMLEALERIYCAFADLLADMQRRTTCKCNACGNMGQLDLKFFVHHGEFFVQRIAGRDELQGPDVIRVHRLLKNTVAKQTGIRAYALITDAAAQAMSVPEFFAAARRHTEAGEMGETHCYVYDVRPVWEQRRAALRIVVSREEPLAIEPLECDLPVPPAAAWSYLIDVEQQMRWRGLDRITMTDLKAGRAGVGSVQHCAHGKEKTLHRVVDWRPFDYVTYHILLPFGAVVRQMVEFTPLDGNRTHVSMRCAQPEGRNAVTTAISRLMLKLVASGIVRQQRAAKIALERIVIDDVGWRAAIEAGAVEMLAH